MYQPKDYYVLKAESNYDRIKRRRKCIKLIINIVLWVAIIGFIAASIAVIATS